MKRRQPSAALRSVLALLLVCAQLFAAVHAVGHVGELSALARLGASAAQADYEGGEPLPAPVFRRLPRPHSRGPPLHSV